MIDQNRIVIGCVAAASNKNYSYLETEYLFRTLNQFGGELSKVKKWACFLEEPNLSMKKVLKELGVVAKIIKPLDERDPYSNKIRLLEESFEEDIDYLVVLDTDIVIARDFSSFICGDSIKAKPAYGDPFGLENWKILFDHLDLKFPIKRITTIQQKEETIPYFGSGVMIIPKKYVKILFEAHSEFIHKLCDQREQGNLPKELPDFRRWHEMISLALALCKTGLDCTSLPLEMNCTSSWMGPIENLSRLNPFVIHHHHNILEDGTIMPSRYEDINPIIDQINKFLIKEKKLPVTSSNVLPHTTLNLLKAGNFFEIIEHLKDLPLDHEDPRLHFHLAKAYQETKNYNESIIRYSESLKKGYRVPFNIYLARGSAYRKAGQLINAEKDLKKAFELDPNREEIIYELSILEKQKIGIIKFVLFRFIKKLTFYLIKKD